MHHNRKAFIIAGEESGDIYAGEIARNLKKFHTNIKLFGIGGHNLEKENVILIEHIKNLSFLGLVEVLKHIPDVLKILKKVKNFLIKEKPDFIILIDFPDFNFKVAKFAKSIGIKVYYFISPQVWAWRRGRVKFIKKFIDKMFVIFPFEKDFYSQFNINVEFVGHPLAMKIRKYLDENPSKKSEKLTIGLLPGSRNKEVETLFPEMINAVKKIKNIDILIGIAKNVNIDLIKKFITDTENIEFIHANTYHLAAKSDIIISSSGTATLESAMFGKPVIIIYKVNLISYILGRILIKVPFIGMPNILLGEMNNPELIQFKCNSNEIYIETMKLIKNRAKRGKISEKNRTLINELYRENIFDFLKSL